MLNIFGTIYRGISQSLSGDRTASERPRPVSECLEKKPLRPQPEALGGDLHALNAIDAEAAHVLPQFIPRQHVPYRPGEAQELRLDPPQCLAAMRVAIKNFHAAHLEERLAYGTDCGSTSSDARQYGCGCRLCNENPPPQQAQPVPDALRKRCSQFVAHG